MALQSHVCYAQSVPHLALSLYDCEVPRKLPQAARAALSPAEVALGRKRVAYGWQLRGEVCEHTALRLGAQCCYVSLPRNSKAAATASQPLPHSFASSGPARNLRAHRELTRLWGGGSWQACIEVCPANPKNFNVDNVRVVKVLSPLPRLCHQLTPFQSAMHDSLHTHRGLPAWC